MNSENFKLNNVFQKNAKVYQTRPVLATKYNQEWKMHGFYILVMDHMKV